MILIGVFPQNLKSIIFNTNFNQPINIDVLPKNLESICFGYNYTQQIIPDAIPPNVKVTFMGGKKIVFNRNHVVGFYSHHLDKLEKYILNKANNEKMSEIYIEYVFYLSTDKYHMVNVEIIEPKINIVKINRLLDEIMLELE